MPAPNELRLFLSSTFVDFQDERDFLSKKVFPALRRLCRDRGVEFTEIDLRWGLTNEDTEKGRIIGTCLQEIDECRPFFIGLLGERYGWVPPIEELAKTPELRSIYPWLEAAIAAGSSVTEMEFRHGFLNNDSGKTRPLVYFRSSQDVHTQDARITRLKQEVSERMGEVPEFNTPAELASLIQRDLTQLIDRNWPPSAARTWLDEERAGHAAFAQSRRKGYVANPSVVDSLDAYLDQPEPILVVTGESGSGKSSLLSYWAQCLRSREPNLFIIEHYIGVTAASTDPDTLMRRLVEEIKERIRSDDPVPPSASELQQSFPSWLGRMTGERMVIIVDAINQLNTDGHFLKWLPDHIQSNIRWIISSTESEALVRLRSRSELLSHTMPEVPVTPITLPERRRVLRTFLANYQKKLDRKQEDKIVRDKKSSSPLFLRTLLEELRIQGKHTQLDNIIAYYLASSDIPDLFAHILERIELDYGAEEVQTLLQRIWAAPHGLSESEIIESSHLDRATLSLLLHAFDFHLIRVKGRLSFFHDHLRQAVESRYLGTIAKKQAAWLKLAAYFKGLEPSAIKALTLPWLLNKAEDWQALQQSLLDISLMPYLTEGSRSYELLSYWLTLEKREEGLVGTEKKAGWNIDVVKEYEASFAELSTALNPKEECQIRYALGLFFRNAGWHEGAAVSERKALDLCEHLPDEIEDIFNLKLDISLELGKAYLDRGELKNASLILEKALVVLGDDKATKNGLHEITDVRHINIRNEYARLLKDQGKYPEAESVSQATLNAASERFGTSHSATQNEMRQLAEILTLEGKFVEAESMHRSVINIIETSLGPESLDIAYYLNQFVLFFRVKGFRTQVNSHTEGNLTKGDYEEAQQLLERAVTVIENRLGKEHPDLGQLLNSFAGLHSENSNWEKAEPLFMRSLAIDEKVNGLEHPRTAMSLNNYAFFLFRQGKYDIAESPYRRALAIQIKVLGDHPDTALTYHNLANLLRRQEKYDEAEESYAQALRIRMATIGPTHDDTARTLDGYGRLMRSMGNLKAAEDFLSRSYSVRKQTHGSDHRDAITVGIELAEVLVEESKTEIAQSLVREIMNSVASDQTLDDTFRKRLDNLSKCL